ncbi:MAG: helix-turn-helix domain-containing protein [Pseudomonadota bacterium]
MKLLDIAEVSQRSGFRPSTLRHYEEIGLISPVERHGLRRQYGSDVLLELALISMGKAAGFSLHEIEQAFSNGGTDRLPREAIRRRAKEIRRQIEQLKSLAHLLEHVADCPADNHMDCPRFNKLLRMAAKSQMKARDHKPRKKKR